MRALSRSFILELEAARLSVHPVCWAHAVGSGVGVGVTWGVGGGLGVAGGMAVKVAAGLGEGTGAVRGLAQPVIQVRQNSTTRLRLAGFQQLPGRKAAIISRQTDRFGLNRRDSLT